MVGPGEADVDLTGAGAADVGREARLGRAHRARPLPVVADGDLPAALSMLAVVGAGAGTVEGLGWWGSGSTAVLGRRRTSAGVAGVEVTSPSDVGVVLVALAVLVAERMAGP